MHKQNIGKLAVVGFFGVFVVFGLFGLQTKASASLINASQVLGQLDINEQPNFTQYNPDSSIVNNYGFDQAANMVVDNVHHRLFVADTNNNRVLVFNLTTDNIPVDFKVHDFKADYVLGQNNFSDNLPNQGLGGFQNQTNRTLWAPGGLAYDADRDMLYVADRDNHRVVAYDISSIDNGEPAAFVFVRSGGNSDLNLFSPRSLALDSLGRRLFVADSIHNRVLVYDLRKTNEPIAVLGQSDFTSSDAGLNAASFDFPTALAFNEVNNVLYVADAGNYRILAFDLNNGLDNGESAVAVLGQYDLNSNVIGQANAMNLFGLANNVSSMSVDPAANLLYVPLSSLSRVMVFDIATIDNGEDAVNVLGQNNFTLLGENQFGTVSATGLSSPTGVAASNNYLYVADSGNNRVLVYNVQSIDNGEVAAVVLGQLNGNGVPIFTQNTVNSATINDHGFKFGFSVFAGGIAADLVNHRLFVADTNNNRVLVFNLDGSNNLIDYVADNVLGQADFISGAQNHGGNVGASTLAGPSALVYDAIRNYLYVSDRWNNRVVVFDLANIANGEAAVHVLGQTNLSANLQGIGPNGLVFPAGLALNSLDSMLFIADETNNRVLAFDVTTITDGEAAVHVLGQTNFTDYLLNHGLNTVDAVGLNSPFGLGFNESNKNLYVADRGNNRVLAFDVTTITDGEAAVHVLGQTNFTEHFPNTADGFSSPTANTLSRPIAVTYDEPSHNLYVSDQDNNRVVVYSMDTLSDGAAATAVLGQPNPTFQNTTGNGQAGVYGPNGLVRINDRLYVIDADNNRVMGFDTLNFPNTVLPSGTVGTSYNKVLNSAFNNYGALTYSVTSGNLPPGLSLDPISRLVSGIPSTAGTFTFTVTAKDTLVNGEFFVYPRVFSITIAPSNGLANLNITKVSNITLDSKIYGPNLANLVLGKWNFAAANSNVTLRKLTFQVVNPTNGNALLNFNTFGAVSLYDGANPVMCGVVPCIANNVNSNIVFTGFTSVISNGHSKEYTLVANTNASGVFSSNKTASIAVKSDSLVDIDARNEVGQSLGTASINYNVSSNNGLAEFRFGASNPYLYHDAYPTLSSISLGNNLALDSRAKIFKFSVTNRGTRDLRFGSVKIIANVDGIAQAGTMGDFRLYEDNGVGGLGTYLAQSNVLVEVHTASPIDLTFNSQLNGIKGALENLLIAPGASRTFIMTANTTNMTANLFPGNMVRVSAKIAGMPGWSGSAWNTGDLMYYYTPLNGVQSGPFSASDSYHVDGISGVSGNVLTYIVQ